MLHKLVPFLKSKAFMFNSTVPYIIQIIFETLLHFIQPKTEEVKIYTI